MLFFRPHCLKLLSFISGHKGADMLKKGAQANVPFCADMEDFFTSTFVWSQGFGSAMWAHKTAMEHN